MPYDHGHDGPYWPMCVVYNATEKREPNGYDMIILPTLY
jgi:hypothetical protein